LDKVRCRRQSERAAALKRLKEEYRLTPELQTIIELSLESLIAKLQSRELLATKVLSAYTAKALEVNENFNCITEFVPQAFVSRMHSINNFHARATTKIINCLGLGR
jgi:hypothetical protein